MSSDPYECIGPKHAIHSGVQELIAGALYDFLGRLTTLKEPLTLSSHDVPHRALEELQQWADARGLDINNADVLHWNERIERARFDGNDNVP